MYLGSRHLKTPDNSIHRTDSAKEEKHISPLLLILPALALIDEQILPERRQYLFTDAIQMAEVLLLLGPELLQR